VRQRVPVPELEEHKHTYSATVKEGRERERMEEKENKRTELSEVNERQRRKV
jgi:hypothetical protein